MTSPLIDAMSTPSSTVSLTPRQRLENALSHLPASGSSAEREQDDKNTLTKTHYSELVEPVQRVNEVMRSYGVEFHLQEFEQGQRIVTRVVDRESGETIRQIPSEEMLRIAESLEKMQGRLIQLKA